MQHALTPAELPRLPTGAGKELQVSVREVQQEIMARAGLQSLGTSSGLGRGGIFRALRIAPGEQQSLFHSFSASPLILALYAVQK